MKIFINHVGYDANLNKKVIVRAPEDANLQNFSIRETSQGQVKFQGKLEFTGPVAKWKDWTFWRGDFSDFREKGEFYITLDGVEAVPSAPFEIEEDLVKKRLQKIALYFLKTQRASGIWDRQDHSIPFHGIREDKVDVHGGWYDASGDYSKYFTHLSYGSYTNPQQIPMTAWILSYMYSHIPAPKFRLDDNKVLQMIVGEEAAHGGDFLCRMQDPEGYFYTTVFDGWSKELHKREICSFQSMKDRRNDLYKAGYRMGAGVAIAALARMASQDLKGEFSPSEYLEKAERGFAHLEEHNREYLNDGTENIIDYYCALLAATELFRSTGKEVYLNAARRRSAQLQSMQKSDENYANFWSANEDGTRPYFHASEAGLPVIALLNYSEIEKDNSLRTQVLDCAKKALCFELQITNEENNPFGYPRQYVKNLKGPKRGAFFFPHDNETLYWWQGENARISSLSAAAYYGAKVFPDLKDQLQSYAGNQLDWILGLNPYDVSMMKGSGRGALDYHFSAPGGISNGITGGVEVEDDIDYMPPKYASNGAMSWRWCEQWLPHTSWFIMALCERTRFKKK